MKFGPYSFEPTNREKILFPTSGLTKGDLIDYYIRVSNFMVPHLKNRPLAMHRFPDGIEGKNFFQKNVPDYFPEWIKTIEIEREEGDSIQMVLANNAATLAYLSNQAVITPHIFLSRAEKLHHPDKMIFDLDPPAGRFDLVVKAAKALRHHLEQSHQLRSFIMTTGSKGLHVVVPLNTDYDFDAVRDFARRLCDALADQYPDDFTTEIRKDKRGQRLFLDYLRNSYGQHSVAPYAVRALPGAPVATPLHWEELDRLTNASQTFTVANISQRLQDSGDAWAGMMRYARKLEI